MRTTTLLHLAFTTPLCLSMPVLASTPYCLGDGSGTACPCGNTDTTGTSGCLNSVSPILGPGAVLSSTGTETLLGDSVVLTVTGMPPSTAVLFLQGTAQVGLGLGAVFGDGLRCAGGTTVRLGIKQATGGTASYPGTGDPLVHIRGLVTIAGTRYYQGWYRDSAGFCTTAVHNLSNGLEIAWT